MAWLWPINKKAGTADDGWKTCTYTKDFIFCENFYNTFDKKAVKKLDKFQWLINIIDQWGSMIHLNQLTFQWHVDVMKKEEIFFQS